MSEEAVEKLCNKILQDAQAEADDIIKKAHQKMEKEIQNVEAQVQDMRTQMQHDVQITIQQEKRTIFSTVAIEVKRAYLLARQHVIDEVLKKVQDKKESLRNDPKYQQILKEFIAQGVLALDKDEVVALINNQDWETFHKQLKIGVQQYLKDEYAKSVTLSIQKNDRSNDLGALIQSKDGHITFDNRFCARLKRNMDFFKIRIQKALAGHITELEKNG